jgi:predicted mannosyl-3-phosphoglycerate phosphatase (HAD superfamily)
MANLSGGVCLRCGTDMGPNHDCIKALRERLNSMAATYNAFVDEYTRVVPQLAQLIQGLNDSLIALAAELDKRTTPTRRNPKKGAG